MNKVIVAVLLTAMLVVVGCGSGGGPRVSANYTKPLPTQVPADMPEAEQQRLFVEAGDAMAAPMHEEYRACLEWHGWPKVDARDACESFVPWNRTDYRDELQVLLWQFRARSYQ